MSCCGRMVLWVVAAALPVVWAAIPWQGEPSGRTALHDRLQSCEQVGLREAQEQLIRRSQDFLV